MHSEAELNFLLSGNKVGDAIYRFVLHVTMQARRFC
jgi:hypothetical protein